MATAVKKEKKTFHRPLDLMMKRFDCSQNQLAAKLGKDRSLMSHWRVRYKGFIPASAWPHCLHVAEENKIPLTLNEIAEGGYA